MTSIAKIPVLRSDNSRKWQFALWSRSYDGSPNPMLSLEERFLAPILPQLRERDVLDVGCGTGRWLERLLESVPHSLTGIDFSPEMLDRARQKLGCRAVLVMGNATSLPISSMSTDVVLASFVASYIEDLNGFAAELRRIARQNCNIYISDVHPETATACKWKRGFRGGNKQIELSTWVRSLEQIIACFHSSGFEVACLLEPPFGISELEIFRSAGKLEAFYAAAGLPAIYILQLRPAQARGISFSSTHEDDKELKLTRARISLDAESAITADLEIQDARINSIATSQHCRGKRGAAKSQPVDLEDCLLLPGLINAHDHLEFGLYPNLGRGPYASSEDWARDIQQAERASIAAQQSVPKDVRLWWGAIRNLLCGVTTVCHHNPLHPEMLKDDFPLRVITKFGWAHSLVMDRQLEAKFKATPADVPFVMHGCEGLDENCADEIFQLDRLGALDDRTILVHGLALSSKSMALLNRRRASLVWCPSSNRFLFGRTHTKEAIASVRQVLLGSDSPLTASGDLLDEVRIAHRDVGVPADELYRMLLGRAAAVFRLHEGQGAIRSGGTADFVAVRDRGLSPADTLASLTIADVELVVVRGRVQLASDGVFRRLPHHAVSRLQPLEVNSILRWVRAPLGRLFRETERVLGCEIKIGGKRVRHVCTAWL